MLDTIFVFTLVFILSVQNGPELKLQFVFLVVPMAFLCVWLVQKLYSCQRMAMQFSLQMALFPLHYPMTSMRGIFSFAFWVIITQKCEAVNFSS